MKKTELTWLAGLLEGEGSFMSAPPSEPNRIRISLDMTDEDVVRRAAGLMGVRYLSVVRDPRNTNWKPYYHLLVRGKRAAELMMLLRPLMGRRRRDQIDAALAGFVFREAGDNTRKLTPEYVRRIRESNRSISELARQYHVARGTIRKVRKRVTWS